MAKSKTFKGIFGDALGNQKVFLRDSRHAAENFGYNKAYLGNGTPRHKFQFFVRIVFNQSPEVSAFVKNYLGIEDQEIVSVMVKNVTMPSMTIDTETLNQYNKKRISQTRIEYQPITITFHDSVEGRTLRLWEMYYEYYFRDGVAPVKMENDGRTRMEREFVMDLLTDKFNGRFGYNLPRVGNHKYLIDKIEIFQVHGGNFSRTEIVHPRVTAFTHDTLDYEDSNGLVEIKMDFAYEDVLYANVNSPMNEQELERFRNGDFWLMANLLTIRNPVRGRKLNVTAPLPNVSCNGGVGTDIVSSATNNFLSSPLGQAVGGIIGQKNIQRVTESIGGIVQSIPGAIGQVASASIFGGTVSLQPDPIKALKTTANQVTRSVVNNAQVFVAGKVAGVVAGGAAAILTGVQAAVTKTPQASSQEAAANGTEPSRPPPETQPVVTPTRGPI